MIDQEKKHPNDEINTQLHTTPIAIIGMSGIFPEASNLQAFWENILKKVDCIREVPSSRWEISEHYDPDPSTPDKTYCKRGAFIPDIDFDPLEFGLPPNILEATDVSQLIGLVVAKDAMEDAGYGEHREFDRDTTGVILGVVGVGTKLYTPLMARLQFPVWEKACKSAGLSDGDIQIVVDKIKAAYVSWEENSFPGTIGNVIAGRIANRLDLGGTNCVVDAACASSLAAVKMAIVELIAGRADMMITGGVDTDNSIGAYMCFSKTPAFSKGEHVRPFDAESDGMMVGEGLGMFVIKRLADAERDGDRIYAVIRGIGSSSDGRFKSIYAPRPEGQAKAIRRAYQEAGFSAATVGLVEAHGTGTMAGDPAEFQSINQVFNEEGADRQSVALGSIKSQIAHTKGAAGAASLAKVTLALYHKVLPATINVKKPNPKLKIEASPFYLNTETRPWIRPADGSPRRAAASSFGFGGTNYHIVLEEYQPDHTSAYRLHSTPQMVLLKGSSVNDLVTNCKEALAKVSGENALLGFTGLLHDSKAVKMTDVEPRLGFIASDPAEARQRLEESLSMLSQHASDDDWATPGGVFYRRSALNPNGKVVALFSGQGSQYVDMGRELAVNFPPFREAFAAMDALFQADGCEPLSKKVYPIPVFEPNQKEAQSKTLQRTEHAQPAIGTTSAGLYQILAAAGFKPDFTAGHSFGELTALWASGALPEQTFYALAHARGKAMAAPDDPSFEAGTMAAVKGDAKRVAEILKGFPEITLANYNAYNQVVVAGTKDAVARVKQALTDQGFSVVQLPVSAAFHTHLVGHAREPFAKAVQAAQVQPPQIPVFSNTTGQAYPTDPAAIRKILSDHILNPVHWVDEIEAIYAQGGYFFIEFGPKNVLTNLVRNILGDRPHLALALNTNPVQDADRQLREAALQLRVAGLPLGDVDPYQPDPRPERSHKKSPVSVRLNGGYYVSEKTRRGYQQALNDGRRVQAHPVATSPVTEPVQNPSLINTATPMVKPAEPTHQPMPLQPINPAQTAQVLSQGLSQLGDHQSETLKVHEQYLSNQSEFSKSFAQLAEVGFSSYAKSTNLGTNYLESLERSLARFHEQQQETQRLHAQYLANQQKFTDQIVDLVRQQQVYGPGQGSVTVAPVMTAPVQTSQPAPIPAPAAPPAAVVTTHLPVPAPAPVSTPVAVSMSEPIQQGSTSVTLEQVSQALFQVVSEKTGYPAELLEPGMDMEADLGIDSIKRVEILGSMQTQFPELPHIEPDVLAELRTLSQVVERLSSTLPTTQTPPAASASTEVVAPAPLPDPAPSLTAAASGPDVDSLTQALLEIVSEKTGYPAEMIDPKMDMEADLGIDSIKRVEILGAVQAMFPELPQVQPDVLSEMRTLAQIIAHYLHQGTQSDATEPTTSEAPAAAPLPPAPDVARGRVRLKPLPAPDHIAFSIPSGQVCLLTDDGSPAVLSLAQAVKECGWRPVVLRFPASMTSGELPNEAGIDVIEVNDLSETHLSQTLEEVTGRFGEIGVFIHLDPGKTGQEPSGFNASTREIVKSIFLIAKHLKEPLAQASLQGRGAFLTVTRLDGNLGLGPGGDFDPQSGGLFGLVKTLNLEWDSVFCRAIDLSPETSPERSAELILSELYDPNRLITEVCYRPEGRATLVVEPAE